MPGLDHNQIDEIFSFHPPRPDTDDADRHDKVRLVCRNAAHAIKDLTPDSPEQTTALRKLQEAMMHANAAIAVHK